MNELTYASLQSVFQLSVAINLTFAVLVALFSTALQREKDILSSVKRGIRMRCERDKSKSEKYDKILQRSDDLDYLVEHRSRRILDFFYIYFQPLFLLMALISLFALFYSSIYLSRPASKLMILFAFICMTPFVVFAAYSLWISYSVSTKVRNLVSEVDNL